MIVRHYSATETVARRITEQHDSQTARVSSYLSAVSVAQSPCLVDGSIRIAVPDMYRTRLQQE